MRGRLKRAREPQLNPPQIQYLQIDLHLLFDLVCFVHVQQFLHCAQSRNQQELRRCETPHVPDNGQFRIAGFGGLLLFSRPTSFKASRISSKSRGVAVACSCTSKGICTTAAKSSCTASGSPRRSKPTLVVAATELIVVERRQKTRRFIAQPASHCRSSKKLNRLHNFAN